MKIEILGSGCPKCRQLYENTQEALIAIGKDAEVVKVEDINIITEYGILMTPGFVVDGEVKSVGKVLSAREIKTIIQG